MSKKLKFKSGKILSLNDVNSSYIELDMVVLSSDKNLNKSRFTEKFIDTYGETIVNFPLQVDRENLENGNYLNLTHKFTGEELLTDSIGTFISKEIREDDDGHKILVGKARVWKRYPYTVEAIKELYYQDKLRFSVEVLVEEEQELGDTKEILKGEIIGVAVVSFPAEPRAKAVLLVAEAYVKDLKELERSEKNLIKVNELTFDQIYKQLWDGLANDYYIVTVSEKHAIVYDYSDGKYYALNYTVEGDKVILNNDDKKIAENIWKVDGQEEVIVSEKDIVMSDIKEKNTLTSEQTKKIKNYEDEVSKQAKEIKNFKTQISQLESNKEKLMSERDKLVSGVVKKDKLLEDAKNLEILGNDTKKQTEAIIKLNNKVQELESTINILTEAKKELDAIKEKQKEQELAEKREVLKDIAIKSKCFSEEEIEKDEDLLKIFEECDENKLKIKIADKVMENIESTSVIIETANSKEIIPSEQDLFND